MPHLDAVVIHCRQPAAIADFYAEILGLPVAPADVAAIKAGTLGEDESVLLGSRDALHVWLTRSASSSPSPAVSILMCVSTPPATWTGWSLSARPAGGMIRRRAGPFLRTRRGTSSAPCTRPTDPACPGPAPAGLPVYRSRGLGRRVYGPGEVHPSGGRRQPALSLVS